MEATVHLPGEGEQIGGPTTVTIKATGEETNNSLSPDSRNRHSRHLAAELCRDQIEPYCA